MKQLLLAGLCLSLGACMMVGPDYEVPGDAAVQRNDLNGPLRQDADSVVSAPVPEDWWQLYQDQRLNELGFSLSDEDLGERLSAGSSTS